MFTSRQLDRYLPSLAIIVSLALTALTISAVVRQGRTLETRELLSLQEAAQREADEHSSEFQAEMKQWTHHAADLAPQDRNELDIWTTRHDFLRFVGVARADEELRIFPLTPTEAPLPHTNTLEDLDDRPRDLDTRSLDYQLTYYEKLSDFESPNTRADIDLAIAAIQRKSHALRTAAMTYKEAANLMQPHPRSIRGAFGARLAAFDCLMGVPGDHSDAQQVLEQLCKDMIAAHEAAWGRGEYALVRRCWERLATATAPPPVNLWEDMLATRAKVRDAVDEIERTYYRYRISSTTANTSNELHFERIDADTSQPLIMAIQHVEPYYDVTLVAALDDVIDRYWEDGRNKSRWRVLPNNEESASLTLITLPVEFGNYVLVPSETELTKLQDSTRRRILLLIGVTAGTAAAWGVVIWLILRGLAQQRELVSLQRRFMADVSHELKTPLALIRLHAETLAEGRLRDESRRHAYHETIARESERLTLLLDNILDFSRIEAGRKEYVFAPCHIGHVVGQAWNLFKPRFVSEGFEVVFEVDPDLPEIRADEQAIQQVVINLLQNAFRYGAKGRYVALRVRQVGAEVRIIIEDHGLGMNKTQIRRLGAIFERGVDPEVRKTRGTGLGLAIVKHIVAAHEGLLEVVSDVGKGSTFTVRLPMSRQTLEDSDTTIH